jgi:hypothetical protein
VAYTNYKQPWSLADGSTILDLGEVEIVSPPADYRVDPEQWLPTPSYDFGGEIELVDYEYSVSRVGQGKGFAVKLLWRAKTRPADNYTLLAEILDADGKVLRAFEYEPVGGQAPTSSWQPGQFVKDQVDVVLPASTPPGDGAVQVRLSWQRPDGSRLSVRRWLLPPEEGLSLGGLTVMEKEGRVFDLPEVQYPLEANLENKTRLIGYDSPQLAQSGETPGFFQLKQADCIANAENCRLHFDFYWQGLSEMEVPYSIFLHVVDQQGQIVTQHDRGPAIRAKQPTTAWLPGEVVLDPVDLPLPPDILPGQYSLRLGMYLPPDGPRLLILDDAEQAIADFVEIGTVEVEP